MTARRPARAGDAVDGRSLSGDRRLVQGVLSASSSTPGAACRPTSSISCMIWGCCSAAVAGAHCAAGDLEHCAGPASGVVSALTRSRRSTRTSPWPGMRGQELRRRRLWVLRSSSPAQTSTGGLSANWMIAEPYKGDLRVTQTELCATYGNLVKLEEMASRSKRFYDALRGDRPYFGLDFVELGLIYEVDVDAVSLKVTIPDHTGLSDRSAGRWSGFKSSSARSKEDLGRVEFVFTPSWSPDLMSEDAKFALGFLSGPAQAALDVSCDNSSRAVATNSGGSTTSIASSSSAATSGNG